MTTLRVVIADDHHVFREGLRALLSGVAGIDIVGEASDTSEAIRVVLETQPDLILMDIQMPGDGGIAAISAVMQQLPQVRVVVLTMYNDDAFLRKAVRAGARGYLLKDAEPDEVLQAITTVARGNVYLGSAVADVGLSLIGSPGTKEARFPQLTERELEVLERMARGLANQAIAARLGVSIKTVQNNVSSLLLKLGARDRAHAVAIARDKGLGEVDSR